MSPFAGIPSLCRMVFFHFSMVSLLFFINTASSLLLNPQTNKQQVLISCLDSFASGKLDSLSENPGYNSLAI